MFSLKIKFYEVGIANMIPKKKARKPLLHQLHFKIINKAFANTWDILCVFAKKSHMA